MKNSKGIQSTVKKELLAQADERLYAATYQLKSCLNEAALGLDPNGLALTWTRELVVRNLLKGAALRDGARSLMIDQTSESKKKV